jgi:hypothetical protein
MWESAVKFYVNQNGKLVPLSSITKQEVFTCRVFILIKHLS